MTLWDTIAGVAPEEHGLPELPHDAPKGREAARLLQAQLLEQFTILSQQSSKIAAQLQGFLQNDVLATGTFTFDSVATPAALQFKATIGLLVVRNLSGANVLSVVPGGPGAGAQTSGRGLWRVPANTRDPIAVNDNEATIYGTAGDSFCYQAFSAGPLPVVG
jgi:hypothetical protein